MLCLNTAYKAMGILSLALRPVGNINQIPVRGERNGKRANDPVNTIKAQL